MALTARKVETAKPGKHCDGRNLYLDVEDTGAKSWFHRYWSQGKDHWMGLGGYPDVELAGAREKNEAARRLRKSGVDPILDRRKETVVIPKFGAFADALAAELAHGFRNEKHRKQWRMTLTIYAAPIRNKPVDQITIEDILGILKPIWLKIPQTAERLRGRIEKVLDAAKARGFRTGENPAAWKGNLAHLLPKRPRSNKHHAAMDYTDVPAFVTRLRAVDTVAACALEYTVLTAVRTGDAISARWADIDLEAKVWTIPETKTGAAHRVPLADSALAILEKMHAARDGAFVFPGRSPGQPLGADTMRAALRRMGEAVATIHGFRSSFRDWIGNETHHPRELAEHALAHAAGDAVEQAYRRSDAIERRRAVMIDWANFCQQRDPADNVTKLPRRA